VAEAMGVKFLAQGNNSSRKTQLGIKPGTYDYQADALAAAYDTSTSLYLTMVTS